MHPFQMALGQVQRAQVIMPELPPDQAEGTVGLAIRAQGRVLLVMIKDQPRGVKVTPHVIDHSIRRRADPGGVAGADDPGAGMQPGQDDG